MITYIFRRADGFYFAEYENDVADISGALNNPGTLKVEDLEGNRIIWENK